MGMNAYSGSLYRVLAHILRLVVMFRNSFHHVLNALNDEWMINFIKCFCRGHI